MLRPLTALVALILSCAAFAQGTGLKPSTGPGKAPAKRSVEVPAAGAGESNAGIESLERIFGCLSVGLPQDWGSATVEVTEIASTGNERQFQARYTFTRKLESTPQPLVPCESTGPARSVHGLNDFLEPEKRLWKRAILTFKSDGKFELKYDYTE